MTLECPLVDFDAVVVVGSAPLRLLLDCFFEVEVVDSETSKTVRFCSAVVDDADATFEAVAMPVLVIYWSIVCGKFSILYTLIFYLQEQRQNFQKSGK